MLINKERVVGSVIGSLAGLAFGFVQAANMNLDFIFAWPGNTIAILLAGITYLLSVIIFSCVAVLIKLLNYILPVSHIGNGIDNFVNNTYIPVVSSFFSTSFLPIVGNMVVYGLIGYGIVVIMQKRRSKKSQG